MNNKQQSIILGVDPGTIVSGYGLIQFDNQSYKPIDYGCIRPPPRFSLSERNLIIFNGIEELIEKYHPDVLVIETQYVKNNVRVALTLGMVRGVIILAAKKRGLLIYQYAPTEAKKAVTGTGRASKFQVQGTVQRLLNLNAPPEPEDAADALALAICHIHSAESVHKKNET